MRIAIFCHSILSDWSHENAHFLRGVVTELIIRGHRVRTFESRTAWSVENLLVDAGPDGLSRLSEYYPHLLPTRYDLTSLDLDVALDGIDLVVVHEWNPPELVRRIGDHRDRGGRYRLLFHDTHHRAKTSPEQMATFELGRYDGVLAFGEALRQVYLARGWAKQVWTWHEGADTRVFRPRLTQDGARETASAGDLVWVGNWGDEARTVELEEFVLGPIRDLGLAARLYGARYTPAAKRRLREAGIEYGGWLSSYRLPEVFAHYRATAHVPRRRYVEALPGIPTIRPFEALACGIPLVSACWNDIEGLLRPGRDYLVANNGEQMRAHLRALLADPAMAHDLARHGRQTVLARHTCAHRVDELLCIAAKLGVDVHAARSSSRAATARVSP